MVLKAADPIGVQLTNQGAWHSQTTLLQDPGLHELFGWIAAQVHGAPSAWGWDLEQARPRFNNAWAVVSRSGDSHGAHIHPNSLFSGVFYLAAPSGSGAIAFLDPRAGALMLQPPFHREAAAREIGRLRLVPETGLLLLFPAWLWHEVELPGPKDLYQLQRWYAACTSERRGLKNLFSPLCAVGQTLVIIPAFQVGRLVPASTSSWKDPLASPTLSVLLPRPVSTLMLSESTRDSSALKSSRVSLPAS